MYTSALLLSGALKVQVRRLGSGQTLQRGSAGRTVICSLSLHPVRQRNGALERVADERGLLASCGRIQPSACSRYSPSGAAAAKKAVLSNRRASYSSRAEPVAAVNCTSAMPPASRALRSAS